MTTVSKSNSESIHLQDCCDFRLPRVMSSTRRAFAWTTSGYRSMPLPRVSRRCGWMRPESADYAIDLDPAGQAIARSWVSGRRCPRMWPSSPTRSGIWRFQPARSRRPSSSASESPMTRRRKRQPDMSGRGNNRLGSLTRAVAIGAGDCDVQNSLVVAMLEVSGIPSRLAVGWIGADGQARTGLHAWAEYQDAEGRWRAVDASSARAAERSAVTTMDPVVKGSDRPLIRTLAWVLLVVVSITLVLIAVVFVVGRRHWRRSFQGGDAGDIVGLLQGAAIRPRSFEGIQALFSRRLLRQVSGRPTSLARAREMARKGRLACGRGRTELARRAVRGGGVVLDLDQAESGVVAEVLAAVNLDQWQELSRPCDR